MARIDGARSRLRKPLVYTIVLAVALTSGATAVFLAGSGNRRADRDALLSYEASVLPIIRDGSRVVQEEMKPSLRAVASAEITPEQLLGRTAAWRGVFVRAREELLALSPPAFMDGIEEAWSASMGAYLATIDAFEAIGRADPASRATMIERAAGLGEQADDLFDGVASVIQFHRRRLGLGPSPDLPDPAPSPGG